MKGVPLLSAWPYWNCLAVRGKASWKAGQPWSSGRTWNTCGRWRATDRSLWKVRGKASPLQQEQPPLGKEPGVCRAPGVSDFYCGGHVQWGERTLTTTGARRSCRCRGLLMSTSLDWCHQVRPLAMLSSEESSSCAFLSFLACWPCAGESRIGYLAQHPLFEQIPALQRDIREPPYCCLGDGTVESVNAWLGPAGTVGFASP
jgi:hypothetical protein